MTEGWVDHNGGTAEMPPAEPRKRRSRKKTPRPDGETPQKREQGSWVAKAPNGELSVWTSEAMARKRAIPQGRFLFVRFGEAMQNDSPLIPDEVHADGPGVYMAVNDSEQWAPFPRELPALQFATPDGAVIRLTNGGVIPR